MRWLGFLAIAGCVHVASDYTCTTDSDCVDDHGTQGRCGPGPTSGCMLPDPTCGTNGYRYDASAGASAGICVLSPTDEAVLDPVDLGTGLVNTDVECIAVGGRYVMFELTTPIAQTVMFDTGGTGTTVATALSIHSGACPASGHGLICETPSSSCASTYTRLVVNMAANSTYCLAVGQAEVTATGTVDLRSFPAGLTASFMANMSNNAIDGTMCNGPDPVAPNCFTAGSQSATVLWTQCPNTPSPNATFTANVTSTIDIGLALRTPLPDGRGVSCKDTINGSSPMPEPMTATLDLGEPYWLMIDAVNGPGGGTGSCTAFTLAFGASSPLR